MRRLKRPVRVRAWAPWLASVLVLAGVLVPALASASLPVGPETRVRGFGLPDGARVGLEGDLSRTPRQAYGLWYGGLASGSLVVPSSAAGLSRPTSSQLALHERINARTIEARLEKVASQSFEYEVGQLVGQPGMGRARLGKIAEVRATRTLRRYAEHEGVEVGEGGLRFQVRGDSSVPDVLYDPARRLFDFKLTPKAVRLGQTSAFRRDFPGYEPQYIFGEK